MKTLISLFLTIISTLTLYAQNSSFIHVTGVAKQEVVPNEIELSFTALEYKKKNEEVLLADIHKQILTIVQSFNIPVENLQVDDFYGSRWMSKRKIHDLNANKQYRLKLSKLDVLDQLIQKLDSINIQEINLEKISHSEIDQFKQEVKIEATKNAKEKAILMTAALDQELGKAFEVIEIIPRQSLPLSCGYGYDEDKLLYKYEDLEYGNELGLSSNSNKVSKVNFRTITLEYTVSIKFKLP